MNAEGIEVRRVEPGVYDVFWAGRLHLGTVRRGGSEFWSYYRWSIDGQPCELVPGGVGGKTRKRAGWRKLEYAAHHVAVMKSGAIIDFECQP